MASLSDIRERLEPLKQEQLESGKQRFLFRGQSKIYPNINSTFARIEEGDRVQAGQAYTTFRYAKNICSGLQGYAIETLDALAVLQHYGWPTPLIDLTGTVEVDVFFALLNSTPGQTAVIYKIDCEALPKDSIVIDHDFMTHELDGGALRHRWLRQDGFAIAPLEWMQADKSKQFDLMAPSFAAALEQFSFTTSDTDHPKIADILCVKNDPIPQHLQNLIRIFCRSQFGDDLCDKLSVAINKMHDEN